MATSFVAVGGIQSESISEFDPRTLGGCVLWLDAADSNTLFTDTEATTLAGNGNAIARWNDKSVSANNATQATVANRPVLNRNAITGSSNIGFTAANSHSLVTGETNLPTGVAAETTFIVTNPANNNSDIIGRTPNGRRLNVNQISPTVNFNLTTGGSTLATNRAIRNTLLTSIISNYIHSLSADGGTSVVTDAQSIVNGLSATGPLFIGRIGGSGNNLTGTISEILVFNRALQNDERQQVEGYLAWKWGLVQNLPTNHPYYYSKAPQTAFQPTSFPSCALWLDAADSNTVVRTGSNVTGWNDKSGNGVNYSRTFPSTTVFPTYEQNVRNSLPGIQIANNEQRLGPAANFTVAASGQTTIFHAMRILTGCSGTFTDTASFNNLGFHSAQFSSGVTTYTANISNGSGGNVSVTSSSLYVPANKTALFGMNANSGTFSLFLNGAADGSTTGATTGNLSISPTFNRDASVIGSFYALETIVYSTSLTTAQRQQVEGYLAWKWGLQGDLPGTHPFNSASYFFNNTRPFSRYFNPTDIDDCLIWIDAADASTVNFTGSNVTSVRDKSGNGNDISNASSILTYTGTINGLNTITCPGSASSSNNFLASSNLPRDPFNHSYFVVCRYPSNVEVTRFLQMSSQFFGHTYSGGNEAYIEDNNQVANGATQFTFYPGTFANRNTAFGGHTFLLAGVRQHSVYNITGNGLTTSPNTNSNGTVIGSGVVPNTSSTAYSITPPLNSGANVGGQLAEVIIYNRGLSTPERQIVEGYLAWKWGIANGISTVMTGTSFPTTHPYASYPPINMPILPLTKLYKRSFDPADLSPVLWFDPQDSATYAINANSRLTSWTSKGSNTLQLTAISGVTGPLITRSATIVSSTAVSQGTGFQFADFSSGGYFQITGAQLTSSTNLRLTLIASPHNIPATRQVTFSQLAGTVAAGTITLASYLPNGSYIVNTAATSTIDITVTANGSTTGTFSGVNGAVEYGNIPIASANVSAATTLTITTSQAHGLSASPPADTITLNFTAGTLPSNAAATTINGTYTVASLPSTTQINITIASQGASTGALTASPAGTVIFPSTGRGLNWTGTPVTVGPTGLGATLVCATHLPRTPVRRGALVPGFFSTAFADGGVSGGDTTSNGRDLRIAMGNAGLYIRKNASVNGITNTQLTTGFNVMNATFSNTAVTGADIPTGTNGLAVKGWRYTNALSNTNYNYVSSVAATTSLSFAQIRIGGNTEATSDTAAFPINSHWYEGGLGDILFFDRVLSLEERQLLEGWLSQKYGCNNTLGATGINTTGPTGGSSIHPYRLNQTNISSINTLGPLITSQNQISNNLAAWFDAAYSPTLSTTHLSFTNVSISNDTGIGAWGSRGGFFSQSIGGAGCPSQPTTGRRPRYILNSVNGLPGVRFSGGAAGSEYALDVPPGSGRLELMMTTQDAHPNTTIIGVIRPTAAATGTIISVSQVSGGSYGIALLYTADPRITFSINNPSTNQSIQSDLLTTGNAYIVVARRLGTQMLIKTIGTGGTTRTSTVTSLCVAGGITSYIRMGNNFGGGSSPFRGDINELMLFRSALSNQAIQQIEGYLAWKWGLQASLPDNHAYKRLPA